MTKETVGTPTKRELILGVPYDFYPYVEPTIERFVRDFYIVVVTHPGICRKVKNV